MGFGSPGDTELHHRVPTSLFQIKFHSPPGLLPSSHGMALKTPTKPPQRTKIRCPVRTLRAYATSSETISKEFPEMLAKLQQIGMSIWFPRGTTWMGHCSLGCIKPVFTAPSPGSELCGEKHTCTLYSAQEWTPAPWARQAELQM